LVVTADASQRRGKEVPLKEKLDNIIDDVPSVESVVVVNRLNKTIKMKQGRDCWWHEERKKASIEFDPVPMEANEPELYFSQVVRQVSQKVLYMRAWLLSFKIIRMQNIIWIINLTMFFGVLLMLAG